MYIVYPQKYVIYPQMYVVFPQMYVTYPQLYVVYPQIYVTNLQLYVIIHRCMSFIPSYISITQVYVVYPQMHVIYHHLYVNLQHMHVVYPQIYIVYPQMYMYLDEKLSRKDAQDLFHNHPAIFVPLLSHSQIKEGEVLVGTMLKREEVWWSDPTDLFTKYRGSLELYKSPLAKRKFVSPTFFSATVTVCWLYMCPSCV